MFTKIITLIGLLVSAMAATAQTPAELTAKAAKSFAREKIFIHFDRDAYIAGETVYFKAYLAEGFLPGTSSTAIDIELINDSSRTIQKLILPVTASMAAGTIDLPKTLMQGSYTVRAFTRRGMNFGTDNFFYHTLKVFNKKVPDLRSFKAAQYAIQFLPEGGHLISGKKNVLGFICTDDRGFPADVEGVIKTADGKTAARFKSSHNGMGKVEITPVFGMAYTAECKAAESTFNYNIPASEAEGATLSVIRRGESVIFEINSKDITSPALQPAYLLGVEEQLVAFNVPLQSSLSVQRGEIPVSTMPSGILQITVFSSTHQPLAERLLFVNSEDFNIEGTFSTPVLNKAPRAFNSFSFKLPDTIPGTYSVAVTDAGDEFAERSKGDNIVTRFLLTDDLRGYIHEPAWYFEKNDESHQASLDLVMLTHGWRRYSWQELKADRFSSLPFKDLNYISFTGTVYDPFSQKAFKNADLGASVDMGDSLFRSYKFPPNDSGFFRMSGMIFTGDATFSFVNNAEKHGRTLIRTQTTDLFSAFDVAKTNVRALDYFSVRPPEAPRRINSPRFTDISYDDGITLKEVILRTKTVSLAKQQEKKYVFANVGTNANATMNFLQNPPRSGGINILEYLKGKLTGVYITGGPTYFVNYRSNRSLIGGPTPMAIYIDGFPSDFYNAAMINTEDVATVSVFATSIGAGPGGALSIALKRPEDRLTTTSNHTQNILKLKGFSAVKDFYSPDYSPEKDPGVINDDRTTLLWDPFIYTGPQGKEIQIKFYNSDNAKKFKVILQGITQEGQLLYFEKNLE